MGVGDNDFAYGLLRGGDDTVAEVDSNGGDGRLPHPFTLLLSGQEEDDVVSVVGTVGLGEGARDKNPSLSRRLFRSPAPANGAIHAQCGMGWWAMGATTACTCRGARGDAAVTACSPARDACWRMMPRACTQLQRELPIGQAPPSLLHRNAQQWTCMR